MGGHIALLVFGVFALGVRGTRYLGCYRDPFESRRLLSGLEKTFEGTLTNEVCRKYCTDNKYRYYGTQWRECFCSNMYPTYKMRADEDDCSRPCDGNEKENCGGDYRLSVFDSLDTSGNQVQNLYTGCFVDSMENRVLRGAKKEDKKLNTPDFCAGFCYKGGFTYAGVQYGEECFCGNSLPGKGKAPDSECNITPCTGDVNIKCGGNWRLAVYSTGIKPDVGPDRSIYMGCFAEYGKFFRLFSGDRFDFSGTLTNKICRTYCSQRGFRYSGTQYMRECYCSNDKPQQTTRANEEECNQNCEGNENEKCGGDFRLSVFDSEGKGTNRVASDYEGCYADGENRLLNGARQDSDMMTPEFCVGICFSKGFTKAGLQYGAECFCGDSAPQSAKVTDSDCNTACAGDSSIKCGGQWRLSIYKTSATSVSSSYVGCYTDQNSPRTLTGGQKEIEGLTTDFCVGFCYRRGYNYAGTQYGKECFCGNTLTGGNLVGSSECNTPCQGDPSQWCGGNWRLSVYKTGIQVVKGPPQQPTCPASLTRVNGKQVCAGKVIFEENFQSPQLDLQKWSYDRFMPTSPDFEFVVYGDSTKNIYIKNGELHIKPTIMDNHSVRNGKLEIKQCTSEQYSVECVRQAASFNILPPVETARINTKDSFAFRYGKVEIRAKMPAGDWIIPQLWLEPKRYSRYGPKYASGKVKLAMSRGNKELACGNVELGSKYLESGVLIGTNDEDVEGMTAVWRSGHGWESDYHTFTFNWTPDNLRFSVDGKEEKAFLKPGQRLADLIDLKKSPNPAWSAGSVIAPFDEEFHVTLGLAVGGMRDFPDGCRSRNSAKPWEDRGVKFLATFWQAKDSWYGTWRNEESALKVDYIKITAL